MSSPQSSIESNGTSQSSSESPKSSSKKMPEEAKTTPPPELKNWREKAIDYVQRKGRLALWARTIATKHLEASSRQQRRMIAAEDVAVAQSMGWPLEQSDSETSNEEGAMSSQTIVGDVQQAPPIVIQSPPPPPQQSTLLPWLLCAASLLGMPAAGAVGYILPRLLTPAAETHTPPSQPAAPPAATPTQLIISPSTDNSQSAFGLGLLTPEQLAERFPSAP